MLIDLEKIAFDPFSVIRVYVCDTNTVMIAFKDNQYYVVAETLQEPDAINLKNEIVTKINEALKND